MMRKIALLLLLLFIFVIPTEKILLVDGLGSIARIIGMLMMAAWLAAVLLIGRIRPITRFHAVVILFVLWNAASFFWTVNSEATLARAITWVQLGLLVLLIWDLFTTTFIINIGLQAFVLGAFFGAAGTIYNYLNATSFVYGRYSAAGQHSVNLGLIMALTIPIAWYLAILYRNESGGRKWLVLINFLYLPVAGIAIALTGSRGAMIAAAPAILFIASTLGTLQIWGRILFVLVSIVGVFAAISVVPESSFERLGSAYAELSGDGNLTGRTLIWEDAIARFMEHPVLGVGSDAFSTIAEMGLVAHNTFLSIAVETGLVGLGLFVLILVIVIQQAFTLPKLESRLWLVVLLCWGLGASALTYEQHKTTWFVLALIVVTRSRDEGRTTYAITPAFYPYDIIEFNDDSNNKELQQNEKRQIHAMTKVINKQQS